MSITAVNRLFSNLDMVSISNIKRRGLSLKSTIVYVNSALFLEARYYVLQVKNVKYETDGMIRQAWSLIAKEKHKQAEELFDKILMVSDKSHKTYFGKFVVCLLQDKDAYPYLKRTVETKNDNTLDDYYRLYLTLYNEFIDLEEDYIPLLELLSVPKKIVAFNKTSYNGRYLDFLTKVSLKDYEDAKKSLVGCMEMKQSIYLKILDTLLDKVIKHQKELRKNYEKQEKELEKQRAVAFAQAIKNRDLSVAKKALELILSFRNQDNKDNYIYYLFLELIETIEMVNNDITFEIMPVNYNYTDEKNSLYTFYEAISAGDFAKALESGKKCRGKLLDSRQSSIKVNLYVILLEMLYEKLEERKNNIDNLYQTLISNIEKGNYKHALNLYNSNSYALKDYNNKLVNYLFNRLINKSSTELIIGLDDEELDMVSEDVIEGIFVEETVAEEQFEESTIEEQAEEVDVKELIEETTIDNPQPKPITLAQPLNNKMQIFLRHNEPNHEYFHKYQVCLVNKRFEEAKTWLDSFAEFLRQNGISKRLDYYYYQIGLGILELSYPEDVVYQRKQMYFLAYNAILDGKYDDALIYLNYYNDTDQINDIRGYLLLGRLYTLTKNKKAAIETYIKANALAPNPDAYYFLGELYYKQHKWADAVFCYLAYNEFYPKESPTVYLNLSECYRHLGKSDKVVKYLKIAEEINIEQKRGLYLKDRILKAEMVDKRKREHFLLNKENKGDVATENN